MRKSICIIALSPIAHDARVLRQIQYLSPHYDLTVIGFGPPHQSYAESRRIRPVDLGMQEDPAVPNLRASLRSRDFKHLHIAHHVTKRARRTLSKLLLWLGTYSPSLHEAWYRRQPIISKATQKATESRCDAYLANDWNTMPIAAQAAGKNNAPLVLDLHEYAPLQYMEGPDQDKQRRLVRHTISKYIPKVCFSITVAESLAHKYKEEFGFLPEVIMNAPDRIDLPEPAVNASSIRLIYHGVASRGRNPELMIETVARCDDRYSLHLMLIPNEYVAELKKLAERLAPGRVFFHDPVPPEKILERIAEFDVGLSIFPPVNYSSFASLPNKFFDYICAGLAVCIGPSPSSTELVNKYGIGVISDTFNPEDIASALNRTSADQWMDMRQASRNASYQLNAGNEMRKLTAIFERLL